ncbi:MAG: DMT family transporter [Gammaproteobacteria bacterium]|nr:DMT family transporter [Gammaproteobacteria bacterium]
MSNAQRSPWIMLWALVAMWGSAFPLTRIAVEQLPPTVVAGGRLLIAAILLIVVLAMTRAARVHDPRAWAFLLLLAVFGNALPFTLISWGQQSIDSGLAGILMACMPLMTLVLAHYALPGERLTPNRVAGFVLGLGGVAVLFGPTPPAAGGSVLAMLAVLAGAACYAVAVVLARLQPATDARVTAAATTGIASLMLLPLWLSADAAAVVWSGVPAGAWAAVALLGVFSTALAAIVYFRLVRRVGAAFVAQLNYLIPLWAVASGVVFLGEQPQPRHAVAVALVFAGLYIAQRSPGSSGGREPATARDA